MFIKKQQKSATKIVVSKFKKMLHFFSDGQYELPCKISTVAQKMAELWKLVCKSKLFICRSSLE
jgi:hypothetical protein